MERTFFKATPIRRRVVSAVMAAVVFSSLLLAVSQALHEKLHADAASTSHHCAVTHFTKQQVLLSEPAADFVAPDFRCVYRVSLAECEAFPEGDYRFSASRAPPFSAFPSIVG